MKYNYGDIVFVEMMSRLKNYQVKADIKKIIKQDGCWWYHLRIIGPEYSGRTLWLAEHQIKNYIPRKKLIFER